MHVTKLGRNIQGAYFALPLRVESPHPPVNPAIAPVFGDTVTNALYYSQLNFRHRASCILGQAFHYSPENAFYIFNQQMYFII